MNREEFEELTHKNNMPITISTNELWCKTPRTLLYGHTEYLYSWHLYMDEQHQLQLHVYVGKETLYTKCFGMRAKVSELFEGDTHYCPISFIPEKCDYIFCKLLTEKNIKLSFENFSGITTTRCIVSCNSENIHET